jgi:hypothetical protein
MSVIVDYSFTRPSAALLKSVGYDGAMRYISREPAGAKPAKNVTAAEIAALHAVGMSVGLVWESTAGRAGQGSSAGTDDVRDAEAMADALGYPRECPIFYAVDFNALPTQVEPYFLAIRKGAKRPVGVYGSANVVDHVRGMGIPYGWQTSAWSGSRISNTAHLYQRLKKTGPRLGVGSTDENQVLAHFPLWSPNYVEPGTPTPPKVIPPQRPLVGPAKGKPASKRTPFPLPVGWYGVDDHTPRSHSGKQARDRAAIRKIQRRVGAVVDGEFGIRTAAAVRLWQGQHGLKVDGAVGPLSWEKMVL